MSGIVLDYTIDDRGLRRKLQRLIRLGRNPQPVLEAVAAIGEATTRERFRIQTDPDGQHWKPSIRAQITGGKTLTKDGHLGDSITHFADGEMAQWGTNRIYAAIQQLGGEIKPVVAKNLRFMIGGRWISKKKVTIPARQFLGVNDGDRLYMLAAAEARVLRMLNAS